MTRFYCCDTQPVSHVTALRRWRLNSEYTCSRAILYSQEKPTQKDPCPKIRVAVHMDIHEYVQRYIHLWISDLSCTMDTHHNTLYNMICHITSFD